VGRNALGVKLFNWTYRDCDIPRQLQINEHNEEARQTIKRSRLLINPMGRFRSYWDICTCVLLLYMSMMLPVEIGFDLKDPELWGIKFWAMLLVDLYFCADILISAITCIYDEKGYLVHDRYLILRSYLQSWAPVDVLSVLPVAYIGYLDSDFENTNNSISRTKDLKVVKLLKLLRLLKILRLARLRRLLIKCQRCCFRSAAACRCLESGVTGPTD
jgi:hypothetical protein